MAPVLGGLPLAGGLFRRNQSHFARSGCAGTGAGKSQCPGSPAPENPRRKFHLHPGWHQGHHCVSPLGR